MISDRLYKLEKRLAKIGLISSLSEEAYVNVYQYAKHMGCGMDRNRAKKIEKVAGQKTFECGLMQGTIGDTKAFPIIVFQLFLEEFFTMEPDRLSDII